MSFWITHIKPSQLVSILQYLDWEHLQQTKKNIDGRSDGTHEG
jgi:hypothetical protein